MLRIKRGSRGTNDFDAVSNLTLRQPIVAAQRIPAHNRDLAAVIRHEVFRELGQKLTRGTEIGPVGAIEEAEAHWRCGRTITDSHDSPVTDPQRRRDAQKTHAFVILDLYFRFTLVVTITNHESRITNHKSQITND